MKKTRRIIYGGCLVISIVIVIAAIVITHARTPKHLVIAKHPVSSAELAAANGKKGHLCYVAIDGKVYQINDSAFWQNGQHAPSGGLAYCGADLSNVIDQSPHGRTVLRTLTVVGPLTK